MKRNKTEIRDPKLEELALMIEWVRQLRGYAEHIEFRLKMLHKEFKKR